MIVFLAFVVAFVAIFFLVKFPVLHIALDRPNQRSLHSVVIPRTGGLGLMLGVAASSSFLTGEHTIVLLSLILAGVSILDDIRGLPVVIRFASHFLVAIWFVCYMLHPGSSLLAIIAILTVVWMTNLYNFMDGSDGLAGGMAVFGFSAYCFSAYLASDQSMLMVCGLIASASLAFLCFNFNPAKIFMGDTGSIPLGFLAGSIGFYGVHSEIWAWWLPLLVFSPFIVDATFTLIKRGLRGEKIWLAHKSHYYQRLIQMGWTHRKLAIFEYFLMFLVGTTALFLTNCSRLTQLLVLSCWSLIYLVLIIIIDKNWHNFQKHKRI